MAALIGDPAALDLLQRLAAEHERPLVRADALRALGEVRQGEGAICDEQAAPVALVIRAIGEFGPALMEVLSRSN